MQDRPAGRISARAESVEVLQRDPEGIDAVVERIGHLAIGALGGWDAVSASLLDGEAVRTYGMTDARIGPIDQAQYESQGGPCVDALRTGEIRYFDGTVTEPRWEPFAEVAAARDVCSVLSFPVRVNGKVMGSLNFYSSEQDALRPGQVEEGSFFAAQTAVDLAQAYLAKEMQLGQLEEALQSRTMIGQATGLLMAQEGLTSDEAFQKLVTISQATNVKLRDIAQRYVETFEKDRLTRS